MNPRSYWVSDYSDRSSLNTQFLLFLLLFRYNKISRIDTVRRFCGSIRFKNLILFALSLQSNPNLFHSFFFGVLLLISQNYVVSLYLPSKLGYIWNVCCLYGYVIVQFVFHFASFDCSYENY